MPPSPRKSKDKTTPDLHVAMAEVARFVRQLGHDLRNHLNAAELQSAYINELAEGAELKEETMRLRAILSEMGTGLQRLTNSLAEIKLTLMPYQARDFTDDLRQKIASQFPGENSAIEWTVAPEDFLLNIDPQVLQPALLELFENAFRHERGSGPLQIKAAPVGDEFIITLAEPKTSRSERLENWGREPLAKMKHGHYGLGLFRARSIIEAHHGRLVASYDSPASSLITTVALPAASA